jgi:hypothetical protein
MFKRYAILQDEAPAGDMLPPGGGDPPAGDPPAAPAAGDPPAAPPAAPPAHRSSLAAMAAELAGETPPAGDPPAGDPPPPAADGRPDWCEEKFWNAETKEVRADALAKSYKELQSRFKASADVPPKEPGDYKIEPLEGETWSLPDEAAKPFQEWAHELGISNKVYNAFLREHLSGVTEARDQAVDRFLAQQTSDARAALVAEHGSEAAAKRIQADYFRGFQAFATPEEMAALESVPDNPAIMNVLARVWNATKEGRPPNAGAQVDSFETLGQEVNILFKTPDGALMKGDHPEHVAAVAKRDAWLAECAKRGIRDTVAYRREKFGA